MYNAMGKRKNEVFNDSNKKTKIDINYNNAENQCVMDTTISSNPYPTTLIAPIINEASYTKICNAIDSKQNVQANENSTNNMDAMELDQSDQKKKPMLPLSPNKNIIEAAEGMRKYWKKEYGDSFDGFEKQTAGRFKPLNK